MSSSAFQRFFDCRKCDELIKPPGGDCFVFRSYRTLPVRLYRRRVLLNVSAR
ncbi:MAG: hypothetical protein O7C39_05930 [Bacteroidetes bacterium]|nr:hypothetical protein [Bacteroidota bacterium]